MMFIVVSLGLMVSGLGIAIAAQLERSTYVFVAATAANALIFNSIDGGNEKVGWLSIPVTALCLPGLLDLWRRWKQSQTVLGGEQSEQQDPESPVGLGRMLRGRDPVRSEPGFWTITIIGTGLGGIALVETMLSDFPGVVRLAAGASWGLIVFLCWVLFVKLRSR